MMDTVERLAQQAAETINGGEFNDGRWYTEGQRQAWRKAMTPAADEIARLREDKAELLKALNQMLDDMGATGHSVCEGVKAMGRYVIAQHQTDEEAFLDYTIHQAVKVLLEVDMISEEQAKAAIAKATGGE